MSLPTSGFSFRVDAVDSDARCGSLTTPRATIETPAFMPVGTQATVKTLAPSDLHEIGASIILSNAYHLYLRPGSAAVRAVRFRWKMATGKIMEETLFIAPTFSCSQSCIQLRSFSSKRY